MARQKKGTAKIDGSWIFSDFSKGLYYLDTPRNISEQLYSLAMIGGKNCWSEKGALVPQYGYIKGASLDLMNHITGYSKIIAGNQNFFLTTTTGKVFLYTASEGLKEYVTPIGSSINPIITRRGNDMICYSGGSCYLFGGFYTESSDITIVSEVELQDFSSYYTCRLDDKYIKYFWAGKDVSVNASDNLRVISANQTKEDKQENKFTLKLASVDEHKTYSEAVALGEKCQIELTLKYVPENEEPTTGDEETSTPTVEEVSLQPILMEVSQNRLFIVNVDGTIYYSAIGVVNNFNQSAGAGFFNGFYNDTSKTLSIEDFLSGTLITKEGGFYYLTISASQSATGSAIYTVNIEKISNCGQQYATDHVIVREKVYAFDSNTGAIVNALSVNVFGAMVSGKPVISSEYLNSQNLGINNTKRWLTYNSEAEVFVLYYGENLNQGLVLTNAGTLFPRQLDKNIDAYIGFNQGVAFITADGEICQDFKKGSIIPNMSCVVDFEAIGLRDNRVICSSLLEITELNGISYNLSTKNAGLSYQKITPSNEIGNGNILLPPMMYSDRSINTIVDSYSMESKWADKISNVTRVYAPMSGREGISITIEFPANTAFCLSALRLPDFSQGD